MSQIITKLEPMTIEVLLAAFNYALTNNLTFSDFKKITESHVQLKFFKIDSPLLEVGVIENGNKVNYKPEKISLRVHSDLRKHYGTIDNGQLNFSKMVDDDFLELNKILPKQQQKYISLIVKRFKAKPTLDKANDILRMFPICFENLKLSSGKWQKEFFTLNAGGVISSFNTALLLEEIGKLDKNLQDVNQEISLLTNEESVIRNKLNLAQVKRAKIILELNTKKNML